MDKSSFELESLENTLLKAAEGYKDTKNIKQQLYREALANDLSVSEATAVVNRVLERLGKTESGKVGGALGVAHNPTKQTKNLVERIRSLKSF